MVRSQVSVVIRRGRNDHWFNSDIKQPKVSRLHGTKGSGFGDLVRRERSRYGHNVKLEILVSLSTSRRGTPIRWLLVESKNQTNHLLDVGTFEFSHLDVGTVSTESLICSVTRDVRSRCGVTCGYGTLCRSQADGHRVHCGLWFSLGKSLQRGDTSFTLVLLVISGRVTLGIVRYNGVDDGG